MAMMWQFRLRDMVNMWVSHDVAHAREHRIPAQCANIVEEAINYLAITNLNSFSWKELPS